jgi:alkylation response protein AidB-like acyl-CoA dehydrogenase
MDFTLSDTQQELAALTRRIATDFATQERLRAVEGAGAHVDRDFWSALAAAGVLAAALPESVGGGGLDLLEQCSVLVELGRAVAPAPYLSSIVVGAAAIAHFGTDDQRERWAAPAARGELLLSAALTEDLTDTPERPSTQARRDGDDWLLDGAKAIVPIGTVADAFLVPADSGDGAAVFVVLPTDPGVSVDAQRLVDADTAASLELAGVRLGDDRRIAGHAGSADLLHWMLARATIGTCAHQFGVLERALELTAEYARERQQFGRPIGSFQAVAQRLADAYIDVEAVRLTMWEAAWRAAQPLPCPTEITTAKFWAADAGHRVAHTAVHVHGGTGIDVDAPTHRYFLAAKRNEFTLGGATVQLRRLGSELAATPG